MTYVEEDHGGYSINEWRDRVHATAVEKGWWEPQEQIVALPLQGGPVTAFVQRTFGELIALVHSEASEALEEHRLGHHPDNLYFSFRSKPGGSGVEVLREIEDGRIMVRPYDSERMVELTPDNAAQYGFEVKPEGIPSEMADIIIRVLDIAGYYGIDIERAMLVKAKYNESRSHRHGGKKL
jgi:NTP pyrophosphatase (non-canonical NTP hydrolase)